MIQNLSQVIKDFSEEEQKVIKAIYFLFVGWMFKEEIGGQKFRLN